MSVTYLITFHIVVNLVFFSLLRGHEAYLRTGPHYDFEHYKQLVHEIAKAFAGLSKDVLDIKERLEQDFDRQDLVEHLDQLQSKEKVKLELVRLTSYGVGQHQQVCERRFRAGMSTIEVLFPKRTLIKP